MQLLCLATLLLSAVTAQPDFFAPEQDEWFPPTDEFEVVTGVPEDGKWTSGDLPESAAASFPHGRPGGFQGLFGRLFRQTEWVTVFKADNVTFQTNSTVDLQEGENIFFGKKVGRSRPLMKLQFVKLVYHATEPSKVSVEYGVLKPKEREGK